MAFPLQRPQKRSAAQRVRLPPPAYAGQVTLSRLTLRDAVTPTTLVEQKQPRFTVLVAELAATDAAAG
ncbi:hypothetical protein HJFPF1_03767 [Paramyrothecium foliicola]|nr:hypothetical protein HJFPF1_03767 [Paramyrothecium foliicola]